jgi:hypothetical protein
LNVAVRRRQGVDFSSAISAIFGVIANAFAESRPLKAKSLNQFYAWIQIEFTAVTR